MMCHDVRRVKPNGKALALHIGVALTSAQNRLINRVCHQNQPVNEPKCHHTERLRSWSGINMEPY
jgi:hypothetical protein